LLTLKTEERQNEGVKTSDGLGYLDSGTMARRAISLPYRTVYRPTAI
jgi:hypothetical protein